MPRVHTLDDVIAFEVSFTDMLTLIPMRMTFVVKDNLPTSLLKVHLHSTTFEVVGINAVGLIPVSHALVF